jgi:hypothetical protein
MNGVAHENTEWDTILQAHGIIETPPASKEHPNEVDQTKNSQRGSREDEDEDDLLVELENDDPSILASYR